MDYGEPKDEQEMLNGIVLILLRLSVLAEFLCVLPLPLRVLLLPPLRYAEAVARAFATEQAGGALALPPASVFGPDGDGRADVSRLARCLRALASIFSGLQAFAGWRLFRDRANGRLAQRAPAMAGWGHAMAAWRAGRLDTS